MSDFLVELGSEELPPKALLTLSKAFSNYICEGLSKAELSFDSSESFASPRRLAVLVKGLADKQPDRQIEKLGPNVKAARDEHGEPTKAAAGFARGFGVTVDDLDTVETDKGERLVFRKTEAGQSAEALIPSIVESALAQLPIAKRMRWGSSRAEFVRPVHWMVLLLGENVIEANVLNTQSGNQSRGHRFHANDWLEIKQPRDYQAALESKGKVIAHFETRRDMVRAQVNEQAKALGGRAVISDELLDEVTALVEWPVALAGGFDQRFLDVPQEALVSSMAEHQKYFHVVDSDGSLLPHFITVANIESSRPQSVIEGNERVIRPRLADAAFFYETDRKTPLMDRRERLGTVTFQAKLGSVLDKSDRIEALVTNFADQLGIDASQAKRAAQLCKCDLVTELVGEFSDLQGIAGRYYATADGEAADVAQAMQEQYLPKFAGDALPQTQVGTLLALADRLDTLVGIFAIGERPTGSKDPFGLRRASLGIVRLIIEKQLPFDLRELVAVALANYSQLQTAQSTADDVIAYVSDRLRAFYEDQGVPVEVYLAVRESGVTQLTDFDKRVKAVNVFNQLPQSEALAAANKRVKNILAKNSDSLAGRADAAKMEVDEEKALLAALSEAVKKTEPMFAAQDYESGLATLAGLRDAVDAFFDNVMVMADDQALRLNRLALLSQLRSQFTLVADISLLAK